MKKGNLMKYIILSLCLLINYNLYSAEYKGIKIDEEITLNDKKLVLNGFGIRKATFMRIKVYVGSLYTLKKSTNENEIHNQDLKMVKLDFLMSLDKEKQSKAWKESLMKFCDKDCDEIKSGIKYLTRYMKNINKKQSMIYEIYPDKVVLIVKGQKMDPILGKHFSKSLLSVFIGPKNVDDGLREGMLGLMKED